MSNLKTKIQFINHASVKISYKSFSLLSDPWYFGNAFHKGWDLIVENTFDQISDVISGVTHIWISHEHPDHFSVGFFKKFEDLIKHEEIIILFQETSDQRVKNFFIKNNFLFSELLNEKPFSIADNFVITCIKDGFYDSALFIETEDIKILNLNDCYVRDDFRANEIYRVTGRCDILLTQFSYAAWKGGEKNSKWRKLAAKEKLDDIDLQVEKFQPKFLIPFASFIYFSNESNKYLNDSVNHPKNVLMKLQNSATSINIMKPFDYFDENKVSENSKVASDYWDEKYKNRTQKKYHQYNLIELTELQNAYTKYKKRIFSSNSIYFIVLARFLSPIKVFKPVIIQLEDLKITIIIDLLSSSLKLSDDSPDLIMSSESFYYILLYPFGFDTLTVNGCFEEGVKNGFIKASKSLTIENLNNIGIKFSPLIFLNLKIVFLFIKQLRKVSNKQKLA
jgi:UDP-MurNAc hydroxylase